MYCVCYQPDVETGQVLTAPDDVRSLSFDVDGLSDEELDSIPRYAASCCYVFPCSYCGVDKNVAISRDKSAF